MRLNYFKNLSFLLSKHINYVNLYLSRRNELYIFCLNLIDNYFLLKFMNKSSLFLTKILSDLCAIDYPQKKYRFQLVYNIFSITYNFRFFFNFFLTENNYLSSVSDLYKSAVWSEREVWDLYGIFFFNNSDLRRILTDYGFEGFPLRKDFPLSGYIELRFDDEKFNIVYEPLELAQEFRLFNFTSPWEKIAI